MLSNISISVSKYRISKLNFCILLIIYLVLELSQELLVVIQRSIDNITTTQTVHIVFLLLDKSPPLTTTDDITILNFSSYIDYRAAAAAEQRRDETTAQYHPQSLSLSYYIADNFILISVTVLPPPPSVRCDVISLLLTAYSHCEPGVLELLGEPVVRPVNNLQYVLHKYK